MADNPEWETVFCHECENTWARHIHGLTCPRCSSEFVEIIENDAGSSDLPTSRREPSPTGFPFFGHPFGQRGSTTRTTEYRSPNGGLSFMTTTYRTPQYPTRRRADSPRPPPLETQLNNPLGMMQDFWEIAESFAPGTTPLGQGRTPRPRANREFNDPDLLDDEGEMEQRRTRSRATRTSRDEDTDLDDFMRTFNELTAQLQAIREGGGRHYTRYRPPVFMNPFFAAFGHNPDVARSGEEFDRIMTQLMDQAQGTNAPPPAPAHAIAMLPKKAMDETMTGDDGLAECSICMDNVEIGTLVTVLPCSHWFHGQCITAWLTQHGTCPHCRQEITAPTPASSSNPPRSTSTPTTAAPGSRENPLVVQEDSTPPAAPSRQPIARERRYGDGANHGWPAWLRYRGHGPSH